MAESAQSTPNEHPIIRIQQRHLRLLRKRLACVSVLDAISFQIPWPQMKQRVNHSQPFHVQAIIGFQVNCSLEKGDGKLRLSNGEEHCRIVQSSAMALIRTGLPQPCLAEPAVTDALWFRSRLCQRIA